MKVPLLPLRDSMLCKPQPTKMGNFDKDFVACVEFLYINEIDEIVKG